MSPIVGIDLGTTNSLVAVWRDGAARIIPNALGEALTPSVVGLDETGELLIGRAAHERLTTHPDLTAAAFKRYMGTNRETRLGPKRLRPEELSALVLKSLKADAESWLGEPVTEAVISVPAYFNDTQRKATRAAGRLAGLNVGRLINEPTAAALAYGLERRDTEGTFLVFDLGGGTFDVSVLELLDGIMEVRASAGDNFLGGEDFVDCLVTGFMRTVGLAAGLDEQGLGPATLQRLRDQAEKAKQRLSLREDAEMRLHWADRDLIWPIDQDTFTTQAADLLSRLAAPVERALRDARIRPADLDEILLVGGATRMPILRRLVARMFGRLPASHIDPDEAVALGAAVQAGLKARDAALDEVVITDVCPYTLGIEVVRPLGSEVQDGWFLPILERNTTVPASRVERVYTIYDRQARVDVDVFQGESRSVADNIPLGRLTIPVPRAKSGEQGIDIRFTYDIDGLLEVQATVISTGSTKAIVIEQTPGALTPKEITRRFEALAALKIHPREQSENRAVLARAERLYEEYLGDDRELIGSLIATFEAALLRQNPDEVETERRALVEALNQIE